MSLLTDNLDDMAFNDLVLDSQSRINVYSPGWTNLNKSDPGVTLIELLSWLAEMQIYSLNRIDKQNYLKFLKLLGIAKPEPAIPAEGEVVFALKNSSEPVKVETGTLVSAFDPDTGKQVIYQLIDDVLVSPNEKAIGRIRQGHLASKEFVSDGSPDFGVSLQEMIVRPKNAQKIEEYLSAKVDDEFWMLKEDLDSSQKSDKHFAAYLNDGIVFFGDNENGLIPRDGAKIIIGYWTGVGAEGNLGEGLINRILDRPDLTYKLIVKNEKPLKGGADAESMASAIERARKDQRNVTRAVTTSDYERLALMCKIRPDGNAGGNPLEIERAKALANYHPVHDQPVPNAVSLVVIPKSKDPRPIPTQDELKSIYEYMSHCRMLGTELFIVPPEYVRISVSATVVRDLKYNPDTVKNEVSKNIFRFFNPKIGGKDKSGWPFGGPVSLSQVYKVISEYEGVDYVIDKDTKIRKWNGGTNGEWENVDGGKLKIPGHALVYVDSQSDNEITVTDPKKE